MILTFKTDECVYTRANFLFDYNSSTTLKGHFFALRWVSSVSTFYVRKLNRGNVWKVACKSLTSLNFYVDGRPNTVPLFYLRDSGNQPLERKIL